MVPLVFTFLSFTVRVWRVRHYFVDSIFTNFGSEIRSTTIVVGFCWFLCAPWEVTGRFVARGKTKVGVVDNRRDCNSCGIISFSSETLLPSTRSSFLSLMLHLSVSTLFALMVLLKYSNRIFVWRLGQC